MRIRILYLVCSLCAYLRMYRKNFTKLGYKNVEILVHGIMYLEGKVNCKKIAESYKEKINHQRLIEFLNRGKFPLRQVIEERVNKLLEITVKHKKNVEDILGEYIIFSIDPTDFKKYKGKKTQGVRYSGDGKSKYLAHTVVMSAIIYGKTTIPFKQILYWGKKAKKGRLQTKAEIFLSLAKKANKYLNNIKGRLRKLKKIVVFDGEGAKETILKYFHSNPDWQGFVTKFPRTRNLSFNEEKIHIRKYLSNLTQKDFQSFLFNGKAIYFHTFRASIPSLAFLGECSFIVIQTQKGNLSQKTFRILFTNISSISTLQFLTIYKRRWLQETYHQILKDSFGLKSSKHRRLVAFFRLIELGNLAYCFLESQRLKSSIFVDSLSSIRQALLLNQSALVSIKHNLAA